MLLLSRKTNEITSRSGTFFADTRFKFGGQAEKNTRLAARMVPYDNRVSKEQGASMPSATITSKGRTTIPKDIREALDLQPRDKVQFTLLPDGTVIMRAKLRRVL